MTAESEIDGVFESAWSDLARVDSNDELESFRSLYMGGSGKIKGLLPAVRSSPPNLKHEVADKLDGMRRKLVSAFNSKLAELRR